MMNVSLGLRIAVVAAAIIPISSCARSSAPTSVAAENSSAPTTSARIADLTNAPGSTFAVTYTDNTTVIDQATVHKAYAGISDDGTTLAFDSSATPISALKP